MKAFLDVDVEDLGGGNDVIHVAGARCAEAATMFVSHREVRNGHQVAVEVIEQHDDEALVLVPGSPLAVCGNRALVPLRTVHRFAAA